jgi:hypothetical protein
LKLFAAIRDRLAKATPAPWTAFETGAWGDGFGIYVGEASSDSKDFKVLAEIRKGMNPLNEVSGDNFQFIAHSPTDIAKLLEAIDVAVEALETYSYGEVTVTGDFRDGLKRTIQVGDFAKQVLDKIREIENK